MKSYKVVTSFSYRLVTTPPLRLSTSSLQFLCKFSRKKLTSFGCHPLDGVIRGGPPPPTPPSDATALQWSLQ